MEIRILGPLEVDHDGRRVALGRRQQALLAILLVHRGTPVPADRILEDLYAGEPPAKTAKTLQVHVSRLRKALGDGSSLQTSAGGYRFSPAPEAVDRERFEDLARRGRAALAEGDATLASERFSEALALWRGPALLDFAYADFAQSEIARLEELRLATLEDRIEAELALGRQAQLVGELDGLVREHPLRERLRAQLMLALYRSGRQAEALEAYQDARRALVDELGIEPGRSLRDLQQAILEQDPAFDLPRAQVDDKPAAPAPTPPAVPDRASIDHESSVRAERKTVTVVHVQVAFAEQEDGRLDPEVLRNATSVVLGQITRAVEAHEGTIDAVTADSVSGVFGLPIVHEDDHLRALRAAEEIRESLADERLAAPPAARLEFRIGVSTGTVVTGVLAGEQARAVTGEPLGTSSRLAREAQHGEIVVDDATQRAARATRRESRFEAPMVGRERERRRLLDAFEQAIGDRSCQLFTITGVAGVGKSRLVHEFLRDLGADALVARGRCLPYGEGITYWPVLEAVRDAAGLEDSDTIDESLVKIRSVLEGEDEAELVPLRLGEIIGLSDELSGAEESFWAVRTFFEALARRRPLVLVFDDIHWGEATFLDLVDHVADWTSDAPVLLVCVARPELLDARPQWGGGKPNSTSIRLEPLSDTESAKLLDNLAGKDLEQAARRRIVETAGGNPLFVEEMLALLLEDGQAAATEVPATIQALLAARLDRLPDDERTSLEAAAVEGQVFHEASVAELTGARLGDLQRALLALVRRDLIRADKPVFTGDRAYRFRHLLIRDAAYESVPKEARAVLHERHAGWLDRRAGERALEFEEILGYHLEQAFRYRSELGPVDAAARDLAALAGHRLGRAGRRALARGDTPAAVKLASRAAALLPANDPLRVHVVPAVRTIQGLGDQLGWAETVLDDAIGTGDPSLQAHAGVQQAFLRLFTETTVDLDGLVSDAMDAIAVFEDLDDELGLARAWRLLQQAHYLGRQSAASADAAERALMHARLADDALEQVEIVDWLGVALFMGATPASEAERRVEFHLEQLRGSRAVDDSVLLGCLAGLVAMQGRLSEARSLIARARPVLDPAYITRLAVVAFHAGLTELLADDPAAAELELRRTLGPLEAIGETSVYCAIVAVLAEAVFRQGRYEEAEELTRISERASHLNDVFAHVTWRPVRAKALARRGELETGERLAVEALAFAAESDFLNAHGNALIDFAEVLQLAGRPSEALPVIDQAIVLFERKENVVSAARARALLEQLRATA